MCNRHRNEGYNGKIRIYRGKTKRGAGDDTIMCAVRTVNDTLLVMNKIKKLIKNN